MPPSQGLEGCPPPQTESVLATVPPVVPSHAYGAPVFRGPYPVFLRNLPVRPREKISGSQRPR